MPRPARPLSPAMLIPAAALTAVATLLPIGLGAQGASRTNAASPEARVARILRTTPLVDGHNDLPWAIREDSIARGDVARFDLRGTVAGHTDLKRLRAGGVGAQFWSVYIPGEPGDRTYARNGEVTSTPGYARVQLEEIDIARRVFARYPDRFAPALRAADVAPAFRAGRVASFMGMEGGHAIENSLGALDSYYRLGVRYMTLTHNVNLDWADSAAMPPKHDGLTDFGRDVVREMNRLGMLVDLSHTAPATMHDARDVAQAPVIFSHSNARRVCDVPRNVPDDVLDRLPKNGGVVMVTFVAGFVSPEVAKLTQPAMREYKKRIEGITDVDEQDRISTEIFGALKLPKVTIAQVADHIDYIRKRIGVAHVGIGGDFDGNENWPEGLSDVSMYPNLFAALIQRGWSDAELKQLAGGNVLRALRGAEAVAARLQATPAPTP